MEATQFINIVRALGRNKRVPRQFLVISKNIFKKGVNFITLLYLYIVYVSTIYETKTTLSEQIKSK